ncbi:MAG TPA: polyhydroxyalkanoate synthesis regulator DNA-binding domain-containing protein [Candidatus Dormibacteraeota bacterium]
MPAGTERHLIKKYANRKLYDTRTSKYVTLDGIADLVREGHDIRVVDRDTGHDITQVVLSQIVLTEERRGPQRLVDAGTDALHERGQALMDYVRKTLNVPGDLVSEVEKRRGNLEGMIDEAIVQTLQRLKLPTRRDIDRLNERIDRLSAEVKRNHGGRPIKAPRKRKASR